MYEPKKKRYNDLSSLHKEMKENNIAPMSFDGARILTKTHQYTLLDGVITVKERKWKS
jgi:hypothetical protein